MTAAQDQTIGVTQWPAHVYSRELSALQPSASNDINATMASEERDATRRVVRTFLDAMRTAVTPELCLLHLIAEPPRIVTVGDIGLRLFRDKDILLANAPTALRDLRRYILDHLCEARVLLQMMQNISRNKDPVSEPLNGVADALQRTIRLLHRCTEQCETTANKPEPGADLWSITVLRKLQKCAEQEHFLEGGTAPEGEYVCPSCHKVFVGQDGRDRHIDVIDPSVLLECPHDDCHRITTRQNAMILHLQGKQSQTAPERMARASHQYTLEEAWDRFNSQQCKYRGVIDRRCPICRLILPENRSWKHFWNVSVACFEQSTTRTYPSHRSGTYDLMQKGTPE